MAYGALKGGERVRAAAGALVVQALIGWALLHGLIVERVAGGNDSLKLFALGEPPAPPPPPPPPPPNPVRDRREEGAAAPPNLRARATEVAMPEPIIQLPIPPPVTASLKPAEGAAPFSGNADIRGPGTGAGGIGDGTGSGRYGDGDGAGGAEIPPRWIRGRLSDRDYPQEFAETSVEGIVSVRYLVDVDGRAKACEVTRSSGNAKLDAITCRGIEARFRFRPSLDDRGRAVPSYVIENHEWIIEDLPPDPPQVIRRKRARLGL